MYSSFSFSAWIGHLCSAPSWRCEGKGGGGEKVHLKTHAPLGGHVGKNGFDWSHNICSLTNRDDRHNDFRQMLSA